MSKYDEWVARKEGFFKSAYPKEIGGSNAAVEDLFELKGYLEGFVTELFDFFLDGFSECLESGQKGTIRLIPSSEYPPEFVLRKILHQASFDLTVIQRAISQRNIPTLDEQLKIFDKLACLAIYTSSIGSPTLGGLIDLVKPFVYFQRDTSVRIVPYANALLIGVPYMALEQPLDILSIPHEIGHHVYQHGRFEATKPIKLTLEKHFAGRSIWLRAWLEEIFADIYGFLIAGPITGFTIQDILSDNLPSGLVMDDGVHPVGVIRPFIYTELLHLTENDELAIHLEDKWTKKRKETGISQLKRLAQNIEVTEGDVRTEVCGVVEEMHKIIKEYFPKTQWTTYTHNSADPDSSIAALYNSFNIQTIISTYAGDTTCLDNHFADKSKFELKKNNEYWLTKQIAYWKSLGNELPPLEPDIWKLIFTAFSWADQPDETRPVHGPEGLR
jgi:hypothetical protein